jgi:hypothetical protein
MPSKSCVASAADHSAVTVAGGGGKGAGFAPDKN